jgi:hypothetical protein
VTASGSDFFSKIPFPLSSRLEVSDDGKIRTKYAAIDTASSLFECYCGKEEFRVRRNLFSDSVEPSIRLYSVAKLAIVGIQMLAIRSLTDRDAKVPNTLIDQRDEEHAEWLLGNVHFVTAYWHHKVS